VFFIQDKKTFSSSGDSSDLAMINSFLSGICVASFVPLQRVLPPRLVFVALAHPTHSQPMPIVLAYPCRLPKAHSDLYRTESEMILCVLRFVLLGWTP